MAPRVRTVALRSLRDAPDNGLSQTSTAAERLALVEVLTEESWSLAGRQCTPVPRSQQAIALRSLRDQSVLDA